MRIGPSLFGLLALVLALVLTRATPRAMAGPVRSLPRTGSRIGLRDPATSAPRVGLRRGGAPAGGLDGLRGRREEALAVSAPENGDHRRIAESRVAVVITAGTGEHLAAPDPGAGVRLTSAAWKTRGAAGFEGVPTGGESGGPPCLASRPLPPSVQVCATAPAEAAARRSDGPRRGGGTERPDRPQARRGGTRRTDGYHDASEATEAGGLDEEFLGAVAHELRSPLGLIKDYAATLLAPDAPRDEGTVRRCLSVVVEASQRLEGLLEQLLDPSRIRAGALALQPRPVRLGPLAQTALERAALRAARHRLRLGVPAGLPPVLADAPRLEQVLDNLLDNALKYSPDGGEVVVSAGSAGAEVVVSVSDQGLGVPAEELGQLFGRFYRGAVARARAIRGDGLGLAICRGIVEAHGGRIWAESPAPGRPPGAGPGTTVSFTLPIAAVPGGPDGM